ncbi:MAG: TonB-dependent receptor [Bacteroidetes bacterium]|nr:TonB-dependent receptor [Bacteroidota bacterium]
MKKSEMMKTMLLALAALLMTNFGYAQSTVKGKVTDLQGNPIPGANIYLLNTTIGVSANKEGEFMLSTSEFGTRTVVVSSIGYETFQQSMELAGKEYTLDVKLREATSELSEVVITAGTIEATNDRKVAVLRPLDIVTTAGAQGDIIGAIQTLPGTTRVGEQTGLFVRGGDASEANVVIDGMIVQNFFTSDVPGIAQRSRFSPFQFKGTAFSSGGYSARFGQALSSVLELNTNDRPTRSTLTAGLSMSGLSRAATKVFNKSSLEITGNYINLTPFYQLANTNFDFYEAPNGGAGSLRWVTQHGDKSIFKLLASHGGFGSGTELPNINVAGERFRFGLKNSNTYTNGSYLHHFSNRTYSFTAFSFGENTDKLSFGGTPSETNEWRLQARTEIGHDLNEKSSLLTGIEWQRFNVARSFDVFASKFDETQVAIYSELEWKPKKNFGLKAGVRGEHSQLLNQTALGPRVSSAIKTGKNSQVSLAGGLFYQSPNNRYLLAGKRANFQQAAHYIANYQWVTDKQTFRVEGYHKSYGHLVRELNTSYNPNPYRWVTTDIDNSGNGYAQGVDVFWRDRKLLKNLDYWISYSFVDTERLYENFTRTATPSFISTHNLNVIAKYFIEPINTNVAATYSYASGRPYYDPNEAGFLSNRAPHYENLSISISYITNIKEVFAVFYAGVDNLLDRKNIFGYRYSNDGTQRYPVEPALYRSVFVGMNISMSAFNRDEI